MWPCMAQLSSGAQHIEGAVQGRYATHPGYAHLFKHITPVAKGRNTAPLTNQMLWTLCIAIEGPLPLARHLHYSNNRYFISASDLFCIFQALTQWLLLQTVNYSVTSPLHEKHQRHKIQKGIREYGCWRKSYSNIENTSVKKLAWKSSLWGIC